MSRDNRLESVVHELLELKNKFPESSEPVHEEAIICMIARRSQVWSTSIIVSGWVDSWSSSVVACPVQ
jgi:hypothetical protein